MDRATLRAELLSDPLSRGYAGMSNREAAESLMIENRPTNRREIPSWEIFESIVPGEYTSLNSEQKSLLGHILSMGTVNIGGSNTRSALGTLFPGGSISRANFAALQSTLISRAVELKLGNVTEGDVERART